MVVVVVVVVAHRWVKRFPKCVVVVAVIDVSVAVSVVVVVVVDGSIPCRHGCHASSSTGSCSRSSGGWNVSLLWWWFRGYNSFHHCIVDDNFSFHYGIEFIERFLRNYGGFSWQWLLSIAVVVIVCIWMQTTTTTTTPIVVVVSEKGWNPGSTHRFVRTRNWTLCNRHFFGMWLWLLLMCCV